MLHYSHPTIFDVFFYEYCRLTHEYLILLPDAVLHHCKVPLIGLLGTGKLKIHLYEISK